MEKCVSEVDVYLPNQPSGSVPGWTMERKSARKYVDYGLAAWVDRGRNIRLTSIHKRLRGQSCRMEEDVVLACCAGENWAQSLAAAWLRSSDTLNRREETK